MEAISEWRELTLREAIKKFLPLTNVSFGVWLVMFQLFIYINHPQITDGGFNPDVAFFYMVLPVLFLAPIAFFRKSQKISEDVPLGRVVVYGVLGALLTYVVVWFVYSQLLGIHFGSTPRNMVMGVILLQVAFVAPTEELVFRSIIPRWFESWMPGKWKYVGLIYSQFLFAVMHLSAYGGDVAALLIAFLIGLLWLSLYRTKIRGRQLGIGFTIGSHACYNLIILGVLSGNISSIVGV